MSDYQNDFNRSYEHIKDRIQKITEALYRVTELFPDEEPLRWMLRKEGVEIFDNLIAVSADSLYSNVKKIDSASRSIGHIVSVLDLASAGTLISGLNFEVLKREYGALFDFINTSKDVMLPQPINFLAETTEQSRSSSAFLPEAGSPDRRERDIVEPNREMARLNKEIVENNIAAAQTAKNNSYPVKTEKINKTDAGKNNKHALPKQTVASSEPDDKMLERHRKILEFIKSSGWVGVGDVSGMFGGGISEKTIQRDLVYMADSGILRKAGDKRWRRYAVL